MVVGSTFDVSFFSSTVPQNWATPSDLEKFYGSDAFASFEAERRSLDPAGTFLNSYLTERGVGP